MSRLSRQLVSSRASLAGILSTRSVVRVMVLTLLTVMLALISATAENKLRLSEGFVNEPYTFSFSNAVKGEGAATWTYTGALPTGITLSATGDLSGTPTSSGEFKFKVTAVAGGVTTFQTDVILRIRPTGFDVGVLNASGANFSADDPFPALALPACTPPPSEFVLGKSTADEETIALDEEAAADVWGAVNLNTLEITNPGLLIQHTLENNPAVAPGAPPVAREPLRAGDYTVIHIVKWKPAKPDAEKTDPQKEAWALYEVVSPGSAGVPPVLKARINPDDKENFDTRIFGSRRVAVLLLHLKTPRTWDIKYKVNINRRVPQPIQNVLELAAFVGGAGELEPKCEPTPVRNVWSARLMVVRHPASDVVVRLNTVTSNVNGEQVSQSKEYMKSYLNEGRYIWDVSLGMPVTSIKELEFSSENGVVTARKVERQNAYGFLNVFFRPVDLNGKSFLTTPHLVLGVPISGKPLDRPIVGLGTGIYRDMFKMNFFAGVAFNRVREPRTLLTGEAATTAQLEGDLDTRRVKKFVFGINFPIRQFIQAVKNAK